ncbi:hypothetical protein [Nocardioides sp. AE5]|uniref:MinD/ParA family ATP-binding protein n=1 Tax=Nocardioides sp. AE5 TaxID=2962573 RepID=UPI002880D34F|nr:hypothetical protein [Nocardioides sp. AE5]MDT0200873.1 hypothetical protein [Nocardioides sp. AE5]
MSNEPDPRPDAMPMVDPADPLGLGDAPSAQAALVGGAPDEGTPEAASADAAGAAPAAAEAGPPASTPAEIVEHDPVPVNPFGVASGGQSQFAPTPAPAAPAAPAAQGQAAQPAPSGPPTGNTPVAPQQSAPPPGQGQQFGQGQPPQGQQGYHQGAPMQPGRHQQQSGQGPSGAQQHTRPAQPVLPPQAANPGYPGAQPAGVRPGPQAPAAYQQNQGPQQHNQQAGPQMPHVPERVPTAQDFLLNRHRTLDIGPATWGWRGFLRKITFGLVKVKMGKAERSWRESRASVQRSFDGPRTIVFANPKGGAAKTTSVLAAGYTFGTVRGGGVVAWDNNETRGTLGIRGERASHSNTTRELLDDLERFQDVYESRIGDLGAFVRSQGDAHFDVLASDERADVTGMIHADDFDAVHRLLERFYHLILVDTGNNLRAENWLAAARTADLIVVTSTVREDTGYSGLWMLDALADAGHPDIRNKTITVLCDPSAKVDDQLAKDLTEVYERRTRAVFRIPYDPALVAGSVIQYGQLSAKTRDAWLKACAAMAEAL